ncbi:MAG TPA: hypothetical protein VMT35_03190 [Ignavibacteriaceae bacterium]|nr:hypothetical protein [Ignavibacteriaceae bacterium]
MSNCTKCHILGEKVHNSKCLDCHAEIKTLISLGKGYHSNKEVMGKDCSLCHNEHHGRNFKIINFNPDDFQHTVTGFELTGRHLKIECSNCHTAKLIKIKFKVRKSSYLGLDTECISCHKDYHRGLLGNECTACHNTFTFIKADKFNHDNAAFKLTGAHISIDCIKCHPKEIIDGNEFRKFKGLFFSDCTPCHKDVHAGKFGNECKSCHETVSFRKIQAQTFDHDKTEFPLVGRHKILECSDCHKSVQVVGIKLKHGKCTDCHEDYHQGEFIIKGKVKDCSACHDESGFKPSLLTIEDHNQTKFKLTGAHLAVSCKSCHFIDDNWHFKISDTECSGCHENVHGAEIKLKSLAKGCLTCHFTESWKKIEYDHNITGFKLLGKHSEINCIDCHLIGENSKTGLLFASVDSKCEFCHKDIHFNQFREEGETDCSRCHISSNWQPTVFDHDKTLFPLKGAHLKADCSGCHKKIGVGEIKYINYKIKDFRCIACH